MRTPKRISLRRWHSFLRWTLPATMGCMVLAMLVNYVLFHDLGPEVLQRALWSGAVLTLVLCAPILTIVSIRFHRLALTNKRLGVVASIDRLTNCLNRGAFSDAVVHYLREANRGTVAQCGALLVIDADHFKTINDRFGHEQGDAALSLIARTIRETLRTGDIVGRMGGEEFGVFLPGVDIRTAQTIADRIRKAVNTAHFAPGGQERVLSVSIGGVAFDIDVDFAELYRSADKSLYEAKSFGRNRVEMTAIHTRHYRRANSLRLAPGA